VGDANGACLANRGRATVPSSLRRLGQLENPSPQTMLAVTSPAEAVSQPGPLGPTAARPGGSARPPWVMAAVGLVALSTIAGVAAFGRGTHQPTPTAQGFGMEAAPPPTSPIEPAKSPAAPATGAAAAPPPPLDPAPSALPRNPSRPVTATPGRTRPPPIATPPVTTAVPRPPVPPSLPPPTAAAKPPNCDPPFSVDATGARHYKPECDN